MRRSLPLHFEQTQGVKNFLGIGCGKAGRQYVGGRAVQHRRVGLLHVHPMLADTFLQSSHIFPAYYGNGQQPGAHQQQNNPADLPGRPMQGGGEKKNCHSRQAVPEAPDHGVEKPFDLYLDPRGQRQIEQFPGGLVQRVTQHLVATFQSEDRSQTAKSQQADRTQADCSGKHEQRGAYTEPAQEPGGQQQLEHQRKDAGVKVEVRKKDRHCVFLNQCLLRNGQKLPAGQGGDQRGNTDHGGDSPQIRRGEHQLHALVQISRAGFAPLHDFLAASDRDLSAAPDQDYQPGTNRNENCHANQQAFRAERPGHDLGEVAGEDPACNAPASDHPEHALRFARSQNVIRQSPNLGGHKSAKEFYPDVECRKQPQQVGVEMGQHPKHCAIAGEKQHASYQQIAQMHFPRNHYIASHNHRHQHGTSNVRVGQLFRLEARQEQGSGGHSADLVGSNDEE